MSAGDTQSGQIQVRLLGGFEFLLDDRPLRLPFSAQRVVAFLALQQLPVQRVYVAVNLWPDSTEQHAHASLRSALWRLGLRGLRVVTATPTHLGFGPSVQVDIDEASSRAKRLVHRTGPPEADDVVQLCDLGEILPDWYDDWVLLARERFHQLRLHALESICEQCAMDQRFGQAVDAGLAAVAIEPLRESAHRVLIASYLAEDNAADAVRQYVLYRQLVKDRLGLDPSPRMHELVRDLPIE
jgi:DNA-binding SARP family transcriptional activator